MPRLYIEVDETVKDAALATPHDEDETNSSLYRRIFLTGIESLNVTESDQAQVEPKEGQFTGLFYN